ncbi:Mrp/NBP35 family ATP-binding protein [Camelimonas sp. ID_303_24]
MITRDQVLAALARVPGPDGVTPLPETGLMSDVAINGDRVYVAIRTEAARAAAMEPLCRAAEQAIAALPGVAGALVALTAETAPGAGGRAAPGAGRGAGGHGAGHRAAPGAGHGAGASRAAAGRNRAAVPGVRHIVAVASGKGGVGKSTTACNLALALSGLGLSVGLLDADIYGPSAPRLFGISEKPEMLENRMLKPPVRWGVKVMSIGFLVDPEAAIIWRGPMVMSALQQLLREVVWGDLDVLVVDMPPGTGDAQLTMAQNVPLAGAVIVSTPQDLALIDARRGVAMFDKVDVPVLGVVENMSTFICPACGTRSDIFGHGGARHEAERIGAPFLGEIPLHMTIRETSDAGRPVVISEPEGPHAAAYRTIAEAIAARLVAGAAARQAPRIVID